MNAMKRARTPFLRFPLSRVTLLALVYLSWRIVRRLSRHWRRTPPMMFYQSSSTLLARLLPRLPRLRAGHSPPPFVPFGVLQTAFANKNCPLDAHVPFEREVVVLESLTFRPCGHLRDSQGPAANNVATQRPTPSPPRGPHLGCDMPRAVDGSRLLLTGDHAKDVPGPTHTTGNETTVKNDNNEQAQPITTPCDDCPCCSAGGITQRKTRCCPHYVPRGVISLDWLLDPAADPATTSASSSPSPSPPRCWSASSPICLLIAGLTGSSSSSYVRRTALALRRARVRAVVFNPRGRGGNPVDTPFLYSAGYTEDLRRVVKRLRRKWPRALLTAVGFSLGANVLAKYVGEEEADCLLTGAIAIACPTDCVAMSNNLLMSVGGRILDPFLVGAVQKVRTQHEGLWRREERKYDQAMRRQSNLGGGARNDDDPGHHPGQDNHAPHAASSANSNPNDRQNATDNNNEPTDRHDDNHNRHLNLPARPLSRHRVDLLRAASARTMYAFDDAIIAPMMGCDNATEYYTEASSSRVLANVRIPLLLLSARNDPICPAGLLPQLGDTNSNHHHRSSLAAAAGAVASAAATAATAAGEAAREAPDCPVLFAVTEEGGHSMVWPEGIRAQGTWAIDVIVEFVLGVTSDISAS